MKFLFKVMEPTTSKCCFKKFCRSAGKTSTTADCNMTMMKPDFLSDLRNHEHWIPLNALS